MKNFFCITFVCLFTAYLIFSPVILFIYQVYLKHENWELIKCNAHINYIQKEIDTDVFEKLVINNKKEILLENHLYDIVSYKVIGNKVSLILIEDDEEEDILDKSDRLIKMLKNIDNSLHGIYWMFFEENKLTYAPYIHFCYSYFQHLIQNSFLIKSVFLDKVTPPPKF